MRAYATQLGVSPDALIICLYVEAAEMDLASSLGIEVYLSVAPPVPPPLFTARILLDSSHVQRNEAAGTGVEAAYAAWYIISIYLS